MNQELYELSNQEHLCDQVAELILEAGQAAIKERGFFTLVLTGGNTVQSVYSCLADRSDEAGFRQLWTKTFFFIGDERWVPADHPDSNGGMAKWLLLEHLGVREDQSILIRTDLENPEKGAGDYEQAIRDFFRKKGIEGTGFPSFDLVLLSMGSDGHVASLFPGTDALNEEEKLVTTSFPPSLTPAVERVTITMPLINSARAVIMLISGAERQAIAREIMADPDGTGRQFPAGKVRPAGQEIWLVVDN